MTDIGSTSKILELSAGGIFAIILIDKVLSWTIKWRDRGKDGNGTVQNGRRMVEAADVIFERPTFVKHDNKSDVIGQGVGKMCEGLESQERLLRELLLSNQSQEKWLEKISNGGARKGG